AEATGRHQPLALVCLRIDHFQDLHDFRGAEGSEAVVKVVARRLKRALDPDDNAFRLAPETFAVVLPGRDLRAARKWAQATTHEIGGQLIEHQRQTVTAGVSSFPPLREPRDLLAEALAALDEAPITGAAPQAAGTVAPVEPPAATSAAAAGGSPPELSIAVSQ
ncbi:MAG TPA: diguanylate cyclase, partial [Thermoleophilia bacterium]|nr:diguanylate cyclase [Thermoleophilia bacterium]